MALLERRMSWQQMQSLRHSVSQDGPLIGMTVDEDHEGDGHVDVGSEM